MNERAWRREPKYAEIIRRLKAEVAAVMPVGTAFPRQRELMKRFGASYATIRKVLETLKAEGIIRTRVGSGMTVLRTPKPREYARVRIGVFSSAPPESADHTLYGQFLQGLMAAQRRTPCELFYLDPNENRETLTAEIRRLGLAGTLFFEDGRPDLLASVAREDIPWMVIHPTRGAKDFCVDIDDEWGVRMAVRELVAAGARSLALYGNTLRGPHNTRKTEAFLSEARLQGFPEARTIIRDAPLSDNVVQRVDAARAFLRELERPVGVLAIDPRYLETLDAALELEGCRVPEDASLVVFGYYGYATRSAFGLLGAIEPPYAEAAALALSALLERRGNPAKETDIRRVRTRFRRLSDCPRPSDGARDK